MNWFQKLFCNHEVDMENLQVPLCKNCGKGIPRLVFTDFRYRQNPLLKRWFIKKNLPKYAEVFKLTTKDKK